MAKAETDLAAAERQYVRQLQARRSELAAEVSKIDAKLRAVGGRASTARAAARAAGKSLMRTIEDVLAKAKSSMSLKDIERAVHEAGYATTAKDLYAQILAAARRSSVVKRVKRGMYAFKSPAKSGAKPTTRAKAKTRKGGPGGSRRKVKRATAKRRPKRGAAKRSGK